VKLFKTIIFIIVFAVISCTQLTADEYTEGLKRAKTEDKPVLLYFFSKYCGYCDKMDRDVLNDREINPTLKNDIVYIRIDVDKKNDIASLYAVRGYPTTAMLDPSGKRIAQIPGYIPKGEFKKMLSYLKGKHYKATTAE